MTTPNDTDRPEAEIVRPQFKSVAGGKGEPEVTTEAAPFLFEDETISADAIDALKLSEPRYMEPTLGTLTDEEGIDFVRMFRANLEMEALFRELGGAQFIGLGEAIKSGALDVTKPSQEYDGSKNVDTEIAGEYFRIKLYLDSIKGQFYWRLAKRFGVFDHKIGIRSKRRIIKGERRY